MEREFRFRAASIEGENNSIVILIDGARFDVYGKFVEQNTRMASHLAEQLALWLTPSTVRALRAELSKMDY